LFLSLYFVSHGARSHGFIGAASRLERDALGHVSHHRELAYDPRCGGEYST